VNEAADATPDTLRIWMDAKATVKVGPFSRGGKSRVPTQAADHDFQPLAKVTPVGIFLPDSDELFLYGVISKVTSDCLVDRLVQWWRRCARGFPGSRPWSSIWTMAPNTIVGGPNFCIAWCSLRRPLGWPCA